MDERRIEPRMICADLVEIRWKDKTGKEISADATVAWTNLYVEKTKVFATTLGHNNDTVADERYLELVARGLLWSVGKLDEAHLKPAKKVMIDD